MNHPLNIAEIAVGGMLMVSSAFALLFTRNRPELVRGFTYRQFVWGMISVFIGGAVIAARQFLFGP